MQVECKVFVIGGGIVGMFVVIVFWQVGLLVDVCDCDLYWKVYGVGIIIIGLIFCVMGKLGVLDEVLCQGYVVDGIDVCVVDGCKFLIIDMCSVVFGGILSVGGILCLMFYSIILVCLLMLEFMMMFGVMVEMLENEVDYVNIVFSMGKSVCYDLVVGLDGIYL